MSGCGGSGSPDEAQKTAAFVALANKVCAEIDAPTLQPLHPLNDEKLKALERADSNVRTLHNLLGDLAQRRRLAEEPGFDGTGYQLKLRIYDGERALGITACMTRPRAPVRHGRG
jgi:hypothetical protein